MTAQEKIKHTLISKGYTGQDLPGQVAQYVKEDDLVSFLFSDPSYTVMRRHRLHPDGTTEHRYSLGADAPADYFLKAMEVRG